MRCVGQAENLVQHLDYAYALIFQSGYILRKNGQRAIDLKNKISWETQKNEKKGNQITLYKTFF